jgi:chromosome segregation ATPase
MDPTLGQTIPQMSIALDTLIDNAPADQFASLAKLKNDLNDQLEALIDKDLPKTDAAYKDAVSSVTQATKALGTATADLTKLEAAISILSKAISAIAKAAALVP